MTTTPLAFAAAAAPTTHATKAASRNPFLFGCAVEKPGPGRLPTHTVIRRARSPTMVLAAPTKATPSTLSVSLATVPPNSTTQKRSVKADSGRGDFSDGGLLAYLKEIGSVDLLQGHEVVECARHVRSLLAWEKIKRQLDAQPLPDSSTTTQTPKHPQPHIPIPVRFSKAEKLQDATPVRNAGLDEWARACGEDPATFEHQLARARMYKDRLVRGNLRLVVSIAKKYANNGVTLADLIQEGSLGLIRGAEKFDHTKGFRFATYVSWWIRQAIQRSISDSSRVIRLPTHVNDIAKKARRLRQEFERANNRLPTNGELAELLEIKEERLSFILNKTVETDTVSLDVPLFANNFDQGKSVSLGDMIENTGETPEEAVSAGLLRDDIENVLLMLSPREREVLRMRYGFDDGKSKNFEEIGAIYCAPPNRIRQIEARAIRKLRHPNFHRCLTDWRQA